MSGLSFLHGNQGLLLDQGSGFDHGPIVGQGRDALPMLMVVLKNPVAAHVGQIVFLTKDVESTFMCVSVREQKSGEGSIGAERYGEWMDGLGREERERRRKVKKKVAASKDFLCLVLVSSPSRPFFGCRGRDE